MYEFLPIERVQSYGKVTTLAAVWAQADEQKLPYVYMLDGCSLGDGVVWPITKDTLMAELVSEFKWANTLGSGPFIQVFEKIDDKWTQFGPQDMKQRLGL